MLDDDFMACVICPYHYENVVLDRLQLLLASHVLNTDHVANTMAPDVAQCSLDTAPLSRAQIAQRARRNRETLNAVHVGVLSRRRFLLKYFRCVALDHF
jgi:hypothetical protein